jgi:RHS repeat-associated protein
LPSVAATSVNYIFTDHLNTPRVITRASDNQMVWRWDQADPFGVAPPNENPAGLGSFRYNPRFPGQLFDAETGLYYNYHRSYSPGIGGYTQSDPIGLQGGINTYAYVGGNPINAVDPLGLWSTPVHNQIISEYGRQHGLIPDQMSAMQQGSREADNMMYQDDNHTYMHAMSSSDEEGAKAEACKKLNKFVNNQLAYSDLLARAGDPFNAYRELGKGLHAIMDSTSPSHAGFRSWHYHHAYKHGIFPTSFENDISKATMDETITRMNNAMSGGKLDCSCYE